MDANAGVGQFSSAEPPNRLLIVFLPRTTLHLDPQTVNLLSAFSVIPIAFDTTGNPAPAISEFNNGQVTQLGAWYVRALVDRVPFPQ